MSEVQAIGNATVFRQMRQARGTIVPASNETAQNRPRDRYESSSGGTAVDLARLGRRYTAAYRRDAETSVVPGSAPAAKSEASAATGRGAAAVIVVSAANYTVTRRATEASTEDATTDWAADTADECTDPATDFDQPADADAPVEYADDAVTEFADVSEENYIEDPYCSEFADEVDQVDDQGIEPGEFDTGEVEFTWGADESDPSLQADELVADTFVPDSASSDLELSQMMSLMGDFGGFGDFGDFGGIDAAMPDMAEWDWTPPEDPLSEVEPETETEAAEEPQATEEVASEALMEEPSDAANNEALPPDTNNATENEDVAWNAGAEGEAAREN